jgi:hypothetical protein
MYQIRPIRHFVYNTRHICRKLIPFFEIEGPTEKNPSEIYFLFFFSRGCTQPPGGNTQWPNRDLTGKNIPLFEMVPEKADGF